MTVPPEVARIAGLRVRPDKWVASIKLAITEFEKVRSPTYEEACRRRNLLAYHRPVIEAARCGRRTPVNWRQQPTGRWSTAGPNVHAITKKFGLRESVVPARGLVFVRGDWCSAHLIIAAGLARDRRLQQDIEAGDAYTFAMGLLAPELGKVGRKVAKILILSSINGAGPDKLAELMVDHGVRVTSEEAERRRCRWLSRYPGLMAYMKEVVRTRAWETPLGRTVSLPSNRESYSGLGWRWQSFEADAMTSVLLRMMVERPRWKIAFICYDEILVEVHPSEAEFAAAEIQNIMDDAIRMVSRLSYGDPNNTAKTNIQYTWGGATVRTLENA